MNTNNKNNNWLPFLTTIPISLFFISLNLYSNSYAIPLVFLTILALGLIWQTKSTLTLTVSKPISLSLLLYFLVNLLFLFIHDELLNTLDNPSRALVAIAVMALLIKYPPKLTWVLFSVTLGAIITGLNAIYHTSILEHSRAFFDVSLGFGMYIQVGDMCAWITVICFIATLYAHHINAKSLLIFGVLGSELGLYGTLLSGVRGAWITLPVMLIVICWLYRKICTKKVLLSILFGITIAISAAYPQLQDRVDGAVQDMAMYQEGNAATSNGQRIDMWKSAIITASRYPLFGYGHKNINEEKARQVEEGLVVATILDFERAHNQFFEELQTKGLVGLSLMLIVYFLPILVFYREYLKARASEHKELMLTSVLGVCHGIIVIGFSMTQHFLNHHSGALLFVFGTAIFTALSANLRHNQDNLA